MKVKIKKLSPNAVIPKYAKSGDAGMDLTAISLEMDEYGNFVYHTGLAFEIPKGYVGLEFPRSSICKKDLTLTNSVGVVDSGYRGEVTAKFKPCIGHFAKNFKQNIDIYNIGERIAQMIIMPYPEIEFEEVEELSDSERGDGAYGSSGK